jgi:PST family polysaccharide transporter
MWLVQVVRMVITLATSIVVTRYLGPDQYGILAIASALAAFPSALVSLPASGLVVRELAKRGEHGVASVLSTAFDLRLTGVALQLVLLAVAALVIGYKFEIVFAVGCIALAAFVHPFYILASAFEFDGRFDRVAIVDLLATLASAALKLVLVYLHAPLLAFAAASMVDAAVLGCLYLTFSSRRASLKPWSGLDRPLALAFLRDGWPLVLAGAASAVVMRTDVIFISRLLGETEVGWYTAATRMTEVFYFFPGLLASVYLPTLARRRVDDLGGYYRLVTNSCGAAFWLGVMIAAGITVAAPIAIPLLLGAKFQPSVVIVQISAWSIAVVALATAFASSLTIENATRVPLYATLVAGLASVVLNLTLIPLAGLAGAALATLAAQVIGILATVAFYRDARLFAALVKALSPRFIVVIASVLMELARKRLRP